MSDCSLIAAYLTVLRSSVRHLPDADDIVAEAEDHLLTAVERIGNEAEVIARFGSAAIVAKVCTEESKRGGAVSTQSTRHAGVAGMAVPTFIGVGMAGNFGIERGALHGASFALLVASFGAFSVAMWGLRKRHGGLGRIGRVALVLFFASPFIAAPSAWARASHSSACRCSY